MTPDVQKEWDELIQRYRNAEEYEKTKYWNDTEEGREWAYKALKKIVQRLGEIFDIMTDEEKQQNFV